MTDWGQLYRDHVDAVSGLASGLTDDQLGTVVPACPDWTVHDVLAHLAGGANDAVTGRMDGAPSPEWTQRHVDERSDRSVAELLAEIREHEDPIVESVGDNPRPALVWNIAVHHADLHEALGLPLLPERFWQPLAQAIGQMHPEVGDQVSPYELFRGGFSRRSRNQMQAWGTDLSADALDEVPIFGPREDDQPIPG